MKISWVMYTMLDQEIVINTGPLIALAIGCDSWEVLRHCGARIVIPVAVLRELHAGRPGSPGRDWPTPPGAILHPMIAIPPYLSAILDAGEAAVLATALVRSANLVAIDELAGRRCARIHGLAVTGSLGLVLRAIRSGMDLDLESVLDRMHQGGIHLSPTVITEARRKAQQKP